MMQKKFQASIIIDTQCLPNKSPLFTVTNNGKPCQEMFEAEFGMNRLEITLLNKGWNDTQVNERGEIVADLNIQIKKFTVDDVDLSHFLKSCRLVTNDGKIQNTYGFLHKNGTVSFDYICPPFLFIRNSGLIKNTESMDHDN